MWGGGKGGGKEREEKGEREGKGGEVRKGRDREERG
jgi:hypothetical protein